MNFLKSNYKMMIVIGLSIVLQVGVFTMIFNPSASGKNKKPIDSSLASENMETMVTGDEIDPIDESKINAVSGHRTSNQTHEDSEGMEEIIEFEPEAEVFPMGKTNVQVGYEHKQPSPSEISKATGKVSGTVKKPDSTTENKGNESSKSNTQKNPNKNSTSSSSKKPSKDKTNTSSNKSDSKEEKKDTVEDVKKKIIGKWKSDQANDSHADMYLEFFEDGSYQKYDEKENVVYSGSYTFSSSDRIKISIKDVKVSGQVKEEKETFTADIDFKDANNFTVKDMKHFDYPNYKKVQD